MNPPDYPYEPEFSPYPAIQPVTEVAAPVRRPRYWLHVLLFLLTLFTTTAVGIQFALSFNQNAPPSADSITSLIQTFARPALLWSGLSFSLTLLTILFAHEMGHYVACLYYRVDASLPYFLPAPTLIGTLGAFIRIRSHILRRRVLFDVGIAGPLAGYVFVLPALAIGLAWSKVVPGAGARGEVIFGTPLLMRLMEAVIFPGVSPDDLLLHPIARGAWVGIFATALNLLPIGQLDGGHILYALWGERQKWVANLFLLALIPLGYLYKPWWVWAVVLYFFGRKHPFLYDLQTLGRGRRWLGALALLVFVLSFTPAPIHLGVNW